MLSQQQTENLSSTNLMEAISLNKPENETVLIFHVNHFKDGYGDLGVGGLSSTFSAI